MAPALKKLKLYLRGKDKLLGKLTKVNIGNVFLLEYQNVPVLFPVLLYSEET